MQTRARAGFLGPHSARVLAEHGLGAGMLHNGRSHGVCAFRGGNGGFELDYARLGGGEAHTVYPQQDLVTDLIAEYLDRGGDLRFGVTVTDVDARTATIGYRDATGTGRATGRFLPGCDGGNGVTRHAMPATATRHRQDHGVPTRWPSRGTSHMLCNTGGRERTASHYRELLAEAGFDVVGTHLLPLDAHLVHARRR